MLFIITYIINYILSFFSKCSAKPKVLLEMQIMCIKHVQLKPLAFQQH